MSIHRNVLANDTIFIICTYLLDAGLCSVVKVNKRLNKVSVHPTPLTTKNTKETKDTRSFLKDVRVMRAAKYHWKV